MQKMSSKLKKPVLVTGATGFIGKRIVSLLLDSEIPVRALVLPKEELPPEWNNSVATIRGSITEKVPVAEAMKNAGTVIHCAAVVSDWGDEELFRQITVEGSRHIFEEAVKNQTRVVLLSSIAVYGTHIYSGTCEEERGFGIPLGPYSRTKQAQEKLAWTYHREHNMDLTVIRPANVYGAGSGPWVNDVVDVIRSGLPSLVGAGGNNAGLIHVDNLAALIIRAAEYEKSNGEVYNASDELDVTWTQYFNDIAAILGMKDQSALPRWMVSISARFFEILYRIFRIKTRPPVTREALNLIGSDNRFPSTRARQKLAFETSVTYKEGISEVQNYIEKHILLSPGNIS